MTRRLATMWLTMMLLPPVASVLTAQSVPPQMTIPAIAKAANGAVVSVVVSDKDGQVLAQGSGFAISENGLIVTNYHVIENSSSAIVKLPDGAFYLVDGMVASDKNRDIAVIKAHGEHFRALTLGDSDRLEVGEEVVAIGNPFSLESTVSNGIVSGLRTVEEQGRKFLQITTPISPGIPIHDWTLSTLIDVSVSKAWIKTDRGEFSHALRQSRNIVHPYEQARSGADFDESTCKVCWQVLNASVDDLLASV